LHCAGEFCTHARSERRLVLRFLDAAFAASQRIPLAITQESATIDRANKRETPIMRALTVLIVAVVTVPSFTQEKPAKERKPRFTVGKETTYVTGPLDKHGYIDYVAALNERLRKGVTPANNAKVLLWKAFGPRPEGGTMPAEYFKWLEISSPPEKGAYYVDLVTHLRAYLHFDGHRFGSPSAAIASGASLMRDVVLVSQADKLDDQMYGASQRPWTSDDYPHLASWLKANEKPLAQVVEAGKRPKYFMPLVPLEQRATGLFGALLPSVQKCREALNALTARAMLHAGEGRTDEAWQDLLTCHRLGRHLASGGTLIEGLVGVAIDAVASGASLSFLERVPGDAKRIRGYLRDLEALPVMPPVADKLDLTERFMLLDIIMMLERDGIEALRNLGSIVPFDIPDPLAKRLFEDVDWDPALRGANLGYDRLAAALRIKDRSERQQKLDRLDDDLKELRRKVLDPVYLTNVLLDKKKPAAARGKVIGDLLMTLLLPAVRKVEAAGDRSEQMQRNLRVAYALAVYQRDHGRYPAKLDDLAPKVLARVPLDIFSGKALIYRPSEKGYLFYSVGVNGQDDQGRWYDDDPPGDDPGVRMPRKWR